MAVAPDAHRVPASNAKLLTSTAAALALGRRFQFVTEIYQRGTGGPLYLRGLGDPVLRGRELRAMARTLRARGVRRVRGVVVDDYHYDARRLAPGFEAFSEGAHYRPTSGALNVDGNAVMITVTAPRRRNHPRVDVLPPSDYVKVRKQVRFLPGRRGRRSTMARIVVQRQIKGSIMWLNISGKMGRRARAWSTRRAVYDPGLNAGWSLRRALVQAGVKVVGTVRRGRRPARARLLLRKRRSLQQVLMAVNRDSDNLAAETLIRAMGQRRAAARASAEAPPAGKRRRRRQRRKPKAADTWKQGLLQLRQTLAEQGIKDFSLGNGSGLHRRSWVTARTMVALLRKVHSERALRRLLWPTLAVAGRSGTLGGRLRDTAAQGVVRAKTGTLSGALALSGFVDSAGEKGPMVFSLLVNGRSDRTVRRHMDRMVELLARYAQGLPLLEPKSQPASQPAPSETTKPEPPRGRN